MTSEKNPVGKPFWVSPAASKKDSEPPLNPPALFLNGCRLLSDDKIPQYMTVTPLKCFKNCCHTARSAFMPWLTLIMWYGFLMPIMISTSRLQRALPGATVLQAKLKRPISDYKAFKESFLLIMTVWMICRRETNLSCGSCITIWIVLNSIPINIIFVLGSVVLSRAYGIPKWLQIFLKGSRLDWHRLEFGGPAKINHLNSEEYGGYMS